METANDNLKTGTIAFSASLGRNECPWTLILLDLKTGNLRYLHDYWNGNRAVAPHWSPDGRYLLYSFNHNCEGVCVYDLAEDRVQRIDQTTDEEGDCQAAWSPDGRYIAYQSNRDYQPDISPNLYIFDVQSGEHRQLTHESGGNPSWTPDGQWIIYYAHGRDLRLYQIRLDGKDDHVFFKLPDKRLRVSKIAWAADGTRIAFPAWVWSDGNTGNPQLGRHYAYMADADGSNPILLTSDTWHNCDCYWSPNGKTVGLLANREKVYGASKIYLVKDGELREVVSQMYDEYERWNFWSPSGEYIAYAPFHGRTYEGRGISVLNIETGEIHEFVPDLMAAYPVWKPTLESTQSAP
jgi:Tol biopolymer transport system component